MNETLIKAAAGRDSSTDVLMGPLRVCSIQNSSASKEGARALLQNTLNPLTKPLHHQQNKEVPALKGRFHTVASSFDYPIQEHPQSSNRKHLLTKKALKKINPVGGSSKAGMLPVS